MTFLGTLYALLAVILSKQQSIVVNLAPKTTWILVLFALLCPIDILGQYALPSLNPNTPNVNPAVIPWRTKSSISLGSEYKKLEYGEPKYSVEISSQYYGMFALAGDLVPKRVRTGFEIVTRGVKIDETNYKGITIEGIGTLEGTRRNTRSTNTIDKSAGASIGPISIGYTDVSKAQFRADDDMTYTLPNYLNTYKVDLRVVDNAGWDEKVERLGVTIRLGKREGSHLVIGYGTRTTTKTKNDFSRELTTSIVNNSTGASASGYPKTTFTRFTVSAHEEKETLTGLGFRNGIDKENKYHFEVFNIRKPEVSFSDNSSNLYTWGEENTNGIIFETQTKKYSFLLEGKQTLLKGFCNFGPAYYCNSSSSFYGIDTSTNQLQLSIGFFINVFRITLGFGNSERTIIKHNATSILSNDAYYLSHSFLINLGYEL